VDEPAGVRVVRSVGKAVAPFPVLRREKAPLGSNILIDL
jgi:hypothetical protein